MVAAQPSRFIAEMGLVVMVFWLHTAVLDTLSLT
jgi:hypothetical protein